MYLSNARRGHRSRWLVPALGAVLAAAALTAPAAALATNPTVTVRVEGESRTWLEPTTVTLGDGTAATTTWNNVGSMPETCPNDSAYAAIEKATQGNWDRGYWTLEMFGETHDFSGPLQDYWVDYYDNDYASVVPCGQTMQDGDTILMQAAPSGPSPDWVPASVPLEISAPSSVIAGTPFNVHVDAWVPPTTNPNGSGIVPASVVQDAAGYDVGRQTSTSSMPSTALDTTDSGGDATITLSTTGWQTVVVYNTTDASNWGRVKARICVKATPLSTC